MLIPSLTGGAERKGCRSCHRRVIQLIFFLLRVTIKNSNTNNFSLETAHLAYYLFIPGTSIPAYLPAAQDSAELFFFLFSPKSFVLCMFPCSHPHPKSKRACSVFQFISSLIYAFQGDIAHMLPFCSQHAHRRPHSSDIPLFLLLSPASAS